MSEPRIRRAFDRRALHAATALALLAGCHPPMGTLRIVAIGAGPLALPMVEATVRGISVPLVFDTGTERHALMDSTAWGCGVETLGIDGRAWDGTGRTVQADLAVDPGVVRVPGLPADRLDAPAVAYSPTFRSVGFWGALSPQRLARSGERVVVDFRTGRFAVLPEDEARPADAGDGAAAGTLEACRQDEEAGGAAPRYLVDGRVAGREARLLVDTGAGRTLLYDDNPAGRELAAEARREDLRQQIDRELGAAPPGDEAPRTGPSQSVEVGGTTELLAVRGVSVALGDWEQTVTVGVASRGERRACSADGVLGFDVLRFCRLSLGPEGGDWRCSSEPAPALEPASALDGPPVRLTTVDAAPGCGRTADELRPEVTGGELPMTYPSLLEAFAVLYADVEAHARRIEDGCRDRGWVTARVRRPPLVRSADELQVRFEVDEGLRYRVGAVTIRIVDANDLELRRLGLDELPWWRQRPGAWYSADEWAQDRFDLLDELEPTIAGIQFHRMDQVPDEAAGTIELRMDVVLEDAAPPPDTAAP